MVWSFSARRYDHMHTMPKYPTSKEFRSIILACSPDEVATRWLLQGVPFVFRRQPRLYAEMRGFLSERLSINQEDIRIVGSARLGFSVAPGKYGKRFGDDSDIDVVVVSPTLYDVAWVDLLKWTMKLKWSMPRWRKDTIIEYHLSALYWGHMRPDLLMFSEVSQRWILAFRSLSLNPDLAAWELNARLYRTWDHARLYHVDSLAKLRTELWEG